MTVAYLAGGRTIAEQLKRAETALNNALDDSTIATLLAEYGYTIEKIREGKTLCQRAHDLHHAQEREYGEQRGATAAVAAARQQAEATFKAIFSIARVAFKNDISAITDLGLNERRKDSMTGWIDQACQFYANALERPALMTKLANYKISADKLETGLAEINELETVRRQQDKERAQAQQSTKDRDRALDALDDWMDDFIAVARVALLSRPQLLESLDVQA